MNKAINSPPPPPMKKIPSVWIKFRWYHFLESKSRKSNLQFCSRYPYFKDLHITDTFWAFCKDVKLKLTPGPNPCMKNCNKQGIHAYGPEEKRLQCLSNHKYMEKTSLASLTKHPLKNQGKPGRLWWYFNSFQKYCKF